MCILSCPTSSIANCKTCTYSADNFWLTYVAFSQSVAAKFRLTDTMLHSQIALCCLSLTLRNVRGNKYWQSGVSEITKYGKKQESKPQLLHVYNKSHTVWQACWDCWHISFIINRMRQENRKEKTKLNKAGTARDDVLRYKCSELKELNNTHQKQTIFSFVAFVKHRKWLLTKSCPFFFLI